MKIQFAKVRETATIPTKDKENLGYDVYADFNIDAAENKDQLESINLDLRFQPISWMKFSVEGEYEQEQSEVTEALFRLSVWHDAFKANVKTPPAGHFGDSELEIGRVCVQLANPDFKYMNGETVTLEGGMGLRP